VTYPTDVGSRVPEPASGTRRESAELAAGAALHEGRFVVGRVLGRGGFGITYEAEDTRLGRRVAVKELFPDGAVRRDSVVLAASDAQEAFVQARDRFLREARVLARFSHPGIVHVFEVFEEHGTAYLVLELLDGDTLSQVLRTKGGPFSERAALDVAARVGGALTVVHRAGMLHRDVSPSNLVVTGSGRIVLIDFGLARSFDTEQSGSMTRIVTPGYAPPEQYLGSGRFGPASDVYGLAATLYRLLTAKVPLAAVDRQHGNHLEPPHRVNEQVSKLVSDGVMDGLELDAHHRPQSIDAFLARIGLDAATPVVSGPVAAGTLPPISPPPAAPPTAAPPFPARPEPAPAPAPAPVPAPVPVAAWGPPPQGASPVALDPGAYLPGPTIGPGEPSRWLVSLPIGGAAVALSSAAPVLLTPLLAFGAVPALATAGDLLVHRARSTWGIETSWVDRQGSATAAVARFVRNLAVSAARALPVLAALAVLVAIWYPMHDIHALVRFSDWYLRAVGAAAGLAIVIPALRGSPTFASGVAVDEIHRRVAPKGRGITQAGVILWLVCLALVAIGLLVSPDVAPLGS
jgi:hypothetical protein